MKTKILLFFEIIFGLPKSILFNFRYLPFKEAIKFPVIVSCYCSFWALHGKLRIEAPIKTGMIKLGVGSFGLIDHRNNKSIFTNSSRGEIIFYGPCRLGPGVKIANSGKLILGENFNVTGDSTIICEDSIEIGKDCLVSWECQIMDTDYHTIIVDGVSKEKSKKIVIGDSVWMGSRSTILKGSVLGDNSVVASGATVVGKYTEKGLLLGGVPAKIVRKNINWQR